MAAGDENPRTIFSEIRWRQENSAGVSTPEFWAFSAFPAESLESLGATQREPDVSAAGFSCSFVGCVCFITVSFDGGPIVIAGP